MTRLVQCQSRSAPEISRGTWSIQEANKQISNKGSPMKLATHNPSPPPPPPPPLTQPPPPRPLPNLRPLFLSRWLLSLCVAFSLLSPHPFLYRSCVVFSPLQNWHSLRNGSQVQTQARTSGSSRRTRVRRCGWIAGPRVSPPPPSPGTRMARSLTPPTTDWRSVASVVIINLNDYNRIDENFQIKFTLAFI